MNQESIAQLLATLLDDAFEEVIPRLREEISRQIDGLEQRSQLTADRLALLRDSAIGKDTADDLIRKRVDEMRADLTAEKLIDDLVQKHVARLPTAERGSPGRDGQFPGVVSWREDKEYPYSTVATYKSGLWFAQRDTEQAPGEENSGWSLIADALNDIDMVWDQEVDIRNFKVYMTRSGGEVHSFDLQVPFPVYRDIWKEGAYEQFDYVTHKGSMWMCLGDTDTKPGTDEGKDFWKLAVKAGRDGKNGVSVTKTLVDEDGHLIVETSNGNKWNAGRVIGPAGEKGDRGEQGRGLGVFTGLDKADDAVPGDFLLDHDTLYVMDEDCKWLDLRGLPGKDSPAFTEVAFSASTKQLEFKRSDGTKLPVAGSETAFKDAILDDLTDGTAFAEKIISIAKQINWTGPAEQGRTYNPGDMVSIGPSKIIICLRSTDQLPNGADAGAVTRDPNWDIFVWLEQSGGGGGGSGGGSTITKEKFAVVQDLTGSFIDDINAMDPAIYLRADEDWFFGYSSSITNYRYIGDKERQIGGNSAPLLTMDDFIVFGFVGGAGDVVGPSGAVDSNFAAFDSTTGKLIKDSGAKASDFATSDQGDKADSSLQPGDNVSELVNDAGYGTGDGDVNGPVSALNNRLASFNGTNGKLIQDSGYYVTNFATNLQGDKADTALQPGDLTEFDGAGTTGYVPDPGSEIGSFLRDDGTWQQISAGGNVDSVFGRTGAVVAQAGDYSAFYATIAQGNLADSSLQPGDNISLLVNNANYLVPSDIDTFTGAGSSGYVPDPGTEQGYFLRDDGTFQQVSSGGGAVDSVFSRTGTVVAEAGDYSAFYATVAQGALADSALQSGDNVSELSNDAGYITAGDIPGDLVTSVFGRTGDILAQLSDYNSFYATVAQGALADSALQPSDNVSELVNDAGYITSSFVVGSYLPLSGGTMTGDVLFDFNGAVAFKDDNALNSGVVTISDYYNPGSQEFVFSADDFESSGNPAHGVRVRGGYVSLDSTSIEVGLPGSLQGSRLISVGVGPDGAAQLGWEPPPVPDYSVSSSNNQNVDIGTGVPPTAWVEIVPALTLGQDIAAEVATAYYSALVQNKTTNRGGSVEISIGVNGANPTTTGVVNYVPPGATVTVSGSQPNSLPFTDGDTIAVYMRIFSSDNSAFGVDVLGATDPSTLLITVPGGGGTGGGDVTSVFGRTGAINALVSDYAAFYATTAEGALAVSAVQPGDNVSDLANDAGYITAGDIPADAVDSVFGRTGVVVAQAADYAAFYATLADGALAQSAVQPGDNVSTLTNDAGYLDDASAFATAAQGALADSATQPGDNVSTLVNDSGYLDDAGAFATAAQGVTADSALQPGDNISELNNDAGYRAYYAGTSLPPVAGFAEDDLFCVTPS